MNPVILQINKTKSKIKKCSRWGNAHGTPDETPLLHNLGNYLQLAFWRYFVHTNTTCFGSEYVIAEIIGNNSDILRA